MLGDPGAIPGGLRAMLGSLSTVPSVDSLQSGLGQCGRTLGNKEVESITCRGRGHGIGWLASLKSQLLSHTVEENCVCVGWGGGGGGRGSFSP